MRKTWLLVLVTGLAIIVEMGLFIFQGHKGCVIVEEENGLVLKVRCGYEQQIVYPYLDKSSGIYCFFLPSFVKNTLYGEDEESLTINNKYLDSWNRLCWEEDEIYHISGHQTDYEVRFMKSENLPTIFVETESGNLDNLYADKANKEKGRMWVAQRTGNVEYVGDISQISKRGQATSFVSKIPFSLELENKAPLCGMRSGKKWKLLSMYYEFNMMQTKIIFDMAKQIGLENAGGCEWVDLYCNGKYMGLYLLAEAVSVGDGRIEIHDLEKDNRKVNQDIDFNCMELIGGEERAYYDIKNPENILGGYLIEKKYMFRIEDSEKAHFVTDSEMAFEIEEPRHPSEMEVDYIADYIERIDTLLREGDLDYKKYIDENSFAAQFLIDMIALELDAMSESTFFYLDMDGILKSGPLWDYDRAMGLYADSDYTRPIEKGLGEMKDWYLTLYQEEAFREKMMVYFKELLPYLKEIVEERIDEYAEWIAPSFQMDMQRWEKEITTEIYRNYDSYIRYLKYFLTGRIQYLSNVWGIKCDMELHDDFFTGEEHTVRLERADGSVVDIFTVQDGEYIKELPELEEDCKYGWAYLGGWRMWSDVLPVFEDTLLVCF